MITVKLYGLLRLDCGIKELTLEAGSIAAVKEALLAKSGRLTPKSLDGCVILINGKPGSRRSKLKEGDQVVLMSPVAGG